MKKLLLAALASSAIATPAMAQDDGHFYAGVEGGVMLVPGYTDFTIFQGEDGNGNSVGTAKHNLGFDVDGINPSRSSRSPATDVRSSPSGSARK